MTRAELEQLRRQVADVPCNGCTACCRRDTIHLGEADDLTAFRWHLEGGVPVLDRRPGGECIYLTDKGCAVHGAPPDICRRFDCRVLFLLTPKTRRRERVQQNPTMRAVYAAGKARLATLK